MKLKNTMSTNRCIKIFNSNGDIEYIFYFKDKEKHPYKASFWIDKEEHDYPFGDIKLSDVELEKKELRFGTKDNKSVWKIKNNTCKREIIERRLRVVYQGASKQYFSKQAAAKSIARKMYGEKHGWGDKSRIEKLKYDKIINRLAKRILKKEK